MNQCYSENINIDIHDFLNSGWQEAINSPERDGYSSMYRDLLAAEKIAIESKKFSKGKALSLLAYVCSLRLIPSSPNEPFKSFIVYDLQAADIQLFAQFSEKVSDVWLQARLADLVWCLTKPRNPKYALLAIDAYRNITLDTETWMRGGQECWERAINLAKMLKGGAGDRIKKIEEAIITVFNESTVDNGFLAVWLSNLLAANNLGLSSCIEIAKKLETMAEEFGLNDDINRAKGFYDSASWWFQKSGIETKVAEMTECIAELWVREANEKISSDQPSHMVAASFYERAIQLYRSIPRSMRETHRVNERLAELHKHLNESGVKSIDEMALVETSSIDISSIKEKAINSVKGKPVIDALAAFANIYSGPRIVQLRKFSEEVIRKYPFLGLMPSTCRSKDGRVISKRPGMGLGDTSSEAYESNVRAEIVNCYLIEVEIAVRGKILPSLEILLFEHRLREGDFISIANNSPIVPKGREYLFGKALFTGYERDFVVALHLLVPQIEHMIRWHLKASGVKTTNLDKDGIENENGLSTLVDIPEVEKIFGEDLVFEMKTLFCDALGANLRNELAHGLLNIEDCESVYSIYAWWFGLKLVFKTFWNASRNLNIEDVETEN